MKSYFWIGFGMTLFAIDRAIKYFFVSSATVCNTGIALGVYIPEQVLFILTGIFLAGIFFWLIWVVREKDDMRAIAVSSIFFGALSNGIDRLLYGCVKDYLYVFPHFMWFNVADMMIFMGAVLYIWNDIKITRENRSI